jgi:hypothetical protein
MSDSVIFKDLPATFPEEDKHKRPAAISSIMIHVVLVSALLLIPLVMPEHIQNSQLMRLVVPLAPRQHGLHRCQSN